jgi:hypothetical protein
VETCRLACDSDGCEAQGIVTSARCTLGRCTLATSCRADRVTCKSLQPTCPEGQIPSVTENACWGPCVMVTECADVGDCERCGDAHCVQFTALANSFTRCIAPEAECKLGNLCECLSPCAPYGCSERDGEIGCFCAGC